MTPQQGPPSDRTPEHQNMFGQKTIGRKTIGQKKFWREESGAGDGNRTHASSLGSYSSTIELHPLRSVILAPAAARGQ